VMNRRAMCCISPIAPRGLPARGRAVPQHACDAQADQPRDAAIRDGGCHSAGGRHAAIAAIPRRHRAISSRGLRWNVAGIVAACAGVRRDRPRQLVGQRPDAQSFGCLLGRCRWGCEEASGSACVRPAGTRRLGKPRNRRQLVVQSPDADEGSRDSTRSATPKAGDASSTTSRPSPTSSSARS